MKRKTLEIILILLFFVWVFSFYKSCEDGLDQTSSDLDTLASWMNGSFSSVEQAAVDSHYFDVRLQMIPLWTQRNDGHWFYVEQAIAQYQDKPYRQRIYHLFENSAGDFQSDVYIFDNPLRFAGNWQNGEPLKGLSPDSLHLRTGCSIILHRDTPDAFIGATQEQNCPSTLHGATYATSEVTISKNVLISWDRGFDANGLQVWGAEKGGYIFKKLSRH